MSLAFKPGLLSVPAFGISVFRLDLGASNTHPKNQTRVSYAHTESHTAAHHPAPPLLTQLAHPHVLPRSIPSSPSLCSCFLSLASSPSPHSLWSPGSQLSFLSPLFLWYIISFASPAASPSRLHSATAHRGHGSVHTPTFLFTACLQESK